VALIEVAPEFERRIRVLGGSSSANLVTCRVLETQAVGICDLAANTERIVRAPARGENLESPQLSADLTRMAYVTRGANRSSVRIINTDGTGDHEVTRSSGAIAILGVRWVNDGTALIVRRTESGPSGVELRYERVSTDGQFERVLCSFNWSVAAVDVSSDGHFVAFERNGPGGDSDLAIIDTDTGVESTLLGDPPNDASPHWLPDGRALIFQSDRGATRGLYLLNVRNGAASGAPVLVHEFSRGTVTPVAVTGDDTLVLQRLTHWYNAFRMSIDLDRGTSSVPKALDRRSSNDETPGVSVSADGRYIAYVAGDLGDKTRAPSRVVILTRDGGLVRETNFVGVLTRRSRVRWSPDDSRLAILSSGGAEVIEILSGSHQEIAAPDAFDLKWAPSGSAVLYATQREIRRYDLASGQTSVAYVSPLPLRTTSTFDIAADGSLLLPTIDGVRIVRPDGRTITRYRAPPDGECAAVAWTHDGSRILVSSRIGRQPFTHAHLAVMGAESGEPVVIPIEGEPVVDLALAPDDDELLLATENGVVTLWMLNGFTH
jgi:Tol biopolymer transport system component